jgi:hypothetical protein
MLAKLSALRAGRALPPPPPPAPETFLVLVSVRAGSTPGNNAAVSTRKMEKIE